MHLGACETPEILRARGNPQVPSCLSSWWLLVALNGHHNIWALGGRTGLRVIRTLTGRDPSFSTAAADCRHLSWWGCTIQTPPQFKIWPHNCLWFLFVFVFFFQSSFPQIHPPVCKEASAPDWEWVKAGFALAEPPLPNASTTSVRFIWVKPRSHNLRVQTNYIAMKGTTFSLTLGYSLFPERTIVEEWFVHSKRCPFSKRFRVQLQMATT